LNPVIRTFLIPPALVAAAIASSFGAEDATAHGHRSLTTAEAIQRLSWEEASRKYPAVIRGVVVCALPQQSAVVVQDSTRGIYVNNVGPEFGRQVQVGDLLEIQGVTDPGNFAPVVEALRITRLGTAALPKPTQATWDQLINGSLDSQYVEIAGIVVAIHSRGVTLLTRGGKITVALHDIPSAALSQYVEALVRIRGCLFASWSGVTRQVRNDEVRFYNAQIAVEESAPADLFAVPAKRAAELLFFDSQASALRRVKVSGQIVHQGETEFYMMDGTAGLRFIPKKTVSLKPGDLVEVVGFPNLAGPSPVLREAVVRSTGSAGLPPPKKLAAQTLFDSRHDATRVRVEGIFLGASADQQTLELQSDLRRFLVRLQSRHDGKIPVGSRLELTGVYSGHGRAIDSFELLVNSSADIRVLARPSWWTLRRLLVVVAALAGVLVVALVWIRLLHHKVQVRTAQLQKEIREREHAERQHALEQERARIARDLHDDLGSSLTEIGMLASSTPGLALQTDDACERLGAIAGKSRSIVNALDEIVWAVDPQRDTLASLIRYLASYAEEFLATLNIACRVQIPHSFPNEVVSGEVRHHLFLAVKEALNNALRHGAATEVIFRVGLAEGRLEISVTDNGTGFEPAGHSNGNGIPNLRDRLEHLGGECEIHSARGHGTTVVLQLPVRKAQV
jgi:signal transduction histidine kinase